MTLVLVSRIIGFVKIALVYMASMDTKTVVVIFNACHCLCVILISFIEFNYMISWPVLNWGYSTLIFLVEINFVGVWGSKTVASWSWIRIFIILCSTLIIVIRICSIFQWVKLTTILFIFVILFFIYWGVVNLARSFYLIVVFNCIINTSHSSIILIIASCLPLVGFLINLLHFTLLICTILSIWRIFIWFITYFWCFWSIMNWNWSLILICNLRLLECHWTFDYKTCTFSKFTILLDLNHIFWSVRNGIVFKF